MDGIIFDVDGTIWDATDSILEGFNEGIRAHLNDEAQISKEQLHAVFGKAMDELFAMLFPQLTPDEQMRIGTLCMEYEAKVLAEKGGNVYTGLIDVIKTLANTYPIYIVSNCQLGYIELMLTWTGLGPFIQDYLCYGHTQKPKSFTIQELMRRNNLTDVVYIGDTLGDQQACEEADIPFIYASYGFGNGIDAQYQVDEASEILDIIRDIDQAQ